MEIDSTSDDETALIYLRLVRHESAAAAAIIEQISLRFSAATALRAALIITLLKQEIQPTHSIPDMAAYTYLLKDSPAAIPWLMQAITCCLECWGIPQMDKSGWQRWQRTPGTTNDAFGNPCQEFRQHLLPFNPLTARKLEQIYRMYGFRAGSYATTALIWLAARADKVGAHGLVELTDREIQEFTYYHSMRKHQDALDRFIELIDTYRIQQQPVSIADPTTTHLALQSEALVVID